MHDFMLKISKDFGRLIAKTEYALDVVCRQNPELENEPAVRDLKNFLLKLVEVREK